MGNKVTWVVALAVVGVLLFLYKRYKIPPELKKDKLTLLDEFGQQIDSPLHQEGTHIIVVWATWCPPCVREMPLLEVVYQQYKEDAHVKFWLVSDENIQKQLSFKENKNITMPLYRLSSGRMQDLGVYSIPCTFIYKDGEVVLKKLGQWTSKKELINTIQKARK